MLAGLLILALAACNFPTPTPGSLTAQPPGSTPGVPNPTIPPLPGSTLAPQTVDIYLIALGDNGQAGVQVGCGDSAVPVPVQIPATQAVLRAALEQLLSLKEQYYGQSGLYNALYQSNLSVESAAIANGAATVYLTGTLTLGGECDDPRAQAQLMQTVTQFRTVHSALIYVNGVPLQDALSGK